MHYKLIVIRFGEQCPSMYLKKKQENVILGAANTTIPLILWFHLSFAKYMQMGMIEEYTYFRQRKHMKDILKDKVKGT